MEYRLNKIEPDLIRQVNDKTAEGKIHKKDKTSKIAVNNEEKQDENKGKAYENDADGTNFKKIILVDAEKIEKIEISVFHNDIKKSKVSMGIFLDVKK